MKQTTTGKKMHKDKVGIIGTGMLGSAVALRLLAKGYDVYVYNRTQNKTDCAKDAGANVLDTPAKVADKVGIIITIVKDADAVRDVSFGVNGIATAASHKELIVADMSTINPTDSKDITSKYKKCGITKIDVPVMGGPDAAVAGSLVGMASGNKQGFNACKDILEHVTQKLFFLGTDPGTAHTIKLAMNMQIAMLALSLAEGITMVSKAGINPSTFLDILNSTYFSTGMSRKKAYKMISGNQKPTFTLANLRKDIGIMIDTAASLGCKLPMTSAAEVTYQDAIDKGHGKLDYTGIIRHIETISAEQAVGNVDSNNNNSSSKQQQP